MKCSQVPSLPEGGGARHGAHKFLRYLKEGVTGMELTSSFVTLKEEVTGMELTSSFVT